MAHRGELLEQAADKIMKATGLGSAVEKAEESCLGSWYRIVVGSVQSLTRPQRLAKFKKDYFDTIIIDEAHHCLSDSYQRVLEHLSLIHIFCPCNGYKHNPILCTYLHSLDYEK